MNRNLTTSDVYLTGYLVARGVRLVRIIPGQMVRWVLDDSDGSASRYRAGFLSGEPVLIDAHALYDAYSKTRRESFSYKVPA
jgi:hypothetical protein